MAKDTVSTFMLERLAGVGRQARLRLPGRRHQRPHRRASTTSATALEFVQMRHEELAAFAALRAREVHRRGRRLPGDLRARARSTCSTGSTTPSSTTSRCVAIVGQQARMSLGADYQQEVDLDALFKDVAARVRADAAWSPSRPRTSIDRAMRIAQGDAHADLRSSSPTTSRS